MREEKGDRDLRMIVFTRVNTIMNIHLSIRRPILDPFLEGQKGNSKIQNKWELLGKLILMVGPIRSDMIILKQGAVHNEWSNTFADPPHIPYLK